MKDYAVTNNNLPEFMGDLQEELKDCSVLMITSRDPYIGKWGMSRLWRSWMGTTADFMAASGVTMPLYVDSQGKFRGRREFNAEDAHSLFTRQWLGVDENGNRLSWSKSGREGMRAATKGERVHAMYKHEQWAIDKGIVLFQPRESEYRELQEEMNA